MKAIKKNDAYNYESIKITLSRMTTPIAYQNKLDELMECKAFDTQAEAEKWLSETPIELELYYEKGYGLFGVEEEAVEESEIHSPYSGAPLLDEEEIDQFNDDDNPQTNSINDDDLNVTSMNDNIDLTKILKDCPKGTKFYSTIYGDVEFDHIKESGIYPIVLRTNNDLYPRVTTNGKHLIEYDNEAECILFPSKDQRDWSKFKAPWYKNDKFDPRTLNPFHKVLIWKDLDCIWMPTLFTYLDFSLEYPRMRYDSLAVKVIPYNDDTKHLLGTSVEAPEYYRYWED